MDTLQLQKNLEFVRPETNWEVVGGSSAADASASINVETGICNVMSGRIFGDSHVQIHEILHAKGALKADQLEDLRRRFYDKFGNKKTQAMTWLLEELRVERLVKEKGYAMPPDRFRIADNLLTACISEIWSLKIHTPFLLKKKAERIAKLIFSCEKMPTVPREVADWMADALPKAFCSLEMPFWERILLKITDTFYQFLNWLRRLWWWLKNLFLKNTSLPKTLPDFKPILNPLMPLSDTFDKVKQLEKLSENLKKNADPRKLEKSLFPTVRKLSKALASGENSYKNLTLVLPPAHSPCPDDTSAMKIPAYITKALMQGLKNKEKRYARSGRRLVVSRLLANSPPFSKHFYRTQKILILLDFSGSMQKWLVPMLEVVARLSANTDFDVMAYSADEKRFILHLIYSDKYFSHAVHYQEGNADCAAFFVARHIQASYDKVIVIGDILFLGPAPINNENLDKHSRIELKSLLKEKRALILTPEQEKDYAKRLSNSLGISQQYLRGFKDEKELREILELAIRET